MPSATAPPLTVHEIDDLLYLTRVNETEELQQTISELAQKYSSSSRGVLQAAVDPESGNALLHYCCANGFTDLLKSLISQLGGNIEAEGSDKDTEQVVPPINKANREGNTPLHWAAYNGQLEIVKILVAAGADMWIKNSAGHLAMFEAERAEKSDVAQYLLRLGGSRVEGAGAERRPSPEDVVEVEVNGAEPEQEQNGVSQVSWESFDEPGPSG